MTVRMDAYRKFQTWVVEPWFLPRWMSKERLEEEKSQGLRQVSVAARRPGVARVWFHAASVGELESLTPVIEAWLREGSEAIISVLSESARGAVGKLRKLEGGGNGGGSGSGASQGGNGRVLYAGYSPWEGHWKSVLKEAHVDGFVTAKYEAWPELWSTLADLEIPLLIVSAKARRSLRIASSLCKVLGGKVPKLTLLTVRDEDTTELRSLFGKSDGVALLKTGEPRWDRVSERAKAGSARARELLERYKSVPRPWGVLAQVWTEDMEVWRGQLGSRKGTLWVVPHRVDAENVALIEAYLQRAGMKVQKTSHKSSEAGQAECILVDEVGVLLELYSAVDWVYVGGGFGVSMHSTIEPALYGLPISCGPSGETKFPEIGELTGTAQLKIVRDSEELGGWLEGLQSVDSARRALWKTQADGRLGATQRVLETIRRACQNPSK